MDNLFKKWCWENWTPTHKRMKKDPYLTSHTKINSKWIKDLDIRPLAIKLLEENIGQKLHDIGFGNDFLHMAPRHREHKKKQTKRLHESEKHFVHQKTLSTE